MAEVGNGLPSSEEDVAMHTIEPTPPTKKCGCWLFFIPDSVVFFSKLKEK